MPLWGKRWVIAPAAENLDAVVADRGAGDDRVAATNHVVARVEPDRVELTLLEHVVLDVGTVAPLVEINTSDLVPGHVHAYPLEVAILHRHPDRARVCIGQRREDATAWILTRHISARRVVE